MDCLPPLASKHFPPLLEADREDFCSAKTLSRLGIRPKLEGLLFKSDSSTLWVGELDKTLEPVVLKRSQHRLFWAPTCQQFPPFGVCWTQQYVIAKDRLRAEYLNQSKAAGRFVLSVVKFEQSRNFSYLVLPRAAFGDLRGFLESSEKWVEMASSISHAMDAIKYDPTEEKHLQVFDIALYFLAPIFLAIQSLEKLGIVHLDIKLDNIMITAGVVPKLADFGASKILPSSSATGELLSNEGWGTPVYAAPEIVAKNQFSMSSDVFSLGMCLVVCITGDFKSASKERLTFNAYKMGNLVRKYEMFCDKEKSGKVWSVERRALVHRLLGILVENSLYPGFKRARPCASWWLRNTPSDERNLAENYLLFAEKLLSILPSERISIQDALNGDVLKEYIGVWMNKQEQSVKTFNRLRSIMESIFNVVIGPFTTTGKEPN